MSGDTASDAEGGRRSASAEREPTRLERSMSPLRVFGLHLLYDVCYALFVVLLSPVFLYKLCTSRRARAGLAQRLGRVPRRPGHGRCIWIHGVSVGEIKAAKGLLDALEARLPAWEIVLSTTTLQGYRVARADYPGRHTFYYPLDFSWVTRRALRRIRPDAVVLMELELWPNFLLSCHHQRVPVCVVNGRISERSYRGYRLVRRLLPEPHERIRFYGVQNEAYARRVRDLGVHPSAVHVTGQMKYDIIDVSSENTERLRAEGRHAMQLEEDAWVLMGGSTHPSEEAALVEAFDRLRRTPGQGAAERPIRLIVAPRHLERLGDVEESVTRGGYRPVRLTALRAGERLGADGVVVLDTIGELARLYAVADLVFVGGSLIPHGGQSMIEPAAAGIAIVFGPHVWNFADSVEALVAADAAVQVAEAGELKEAVSKMFADDAGRRAIGERARRVVSGLKGASARNADLIAEMTPPAA